MFPVNSVVITQDKRVGRVQGTMTGGTVLVAFRPSFFGDWVLQEPDYHGFWVLREFPRESLTLIGEVRWQSS
jgi:hypothetical protein